MEDNKELREQVKQKFEEYLAARKHRRTPERFAILDQVYQKKGHFDMDALYNSMVEANFRVSRATLYNTMELLLDCGLVIKHQFGNNNSMYERAEGNENHDHIICTNCGKVWELKNGNLCSGGLQRKIKKFTVSYYSMYIYGICSKCSYAKRVELNRLKRQQTKKKKK